MIDPSTGEVTSLVGTIPSDRKFLAIGLDNDTLLLRFNLQKMVAIPPDICDLHDKESVQHRIIYVRISLQACSEGQGELLPCKFTRQNFCDLPSRRRDFIVLRVAVHGCIIYSSTPEVDT
jgi:hypothetical protein